MLPDGDSSGMIDAMKSAIDAAGRLVLPKPVREEVGLRAGDPVEITVRDGHIEIEPVPREVRITERSGFHVAEPVGPYEPLRGETVRKVIRRGRAERKR
jgi:AbrB family looped-hinge helix DNA binding protein